MKSSQLIGAATVLGLAMITSTNVFAKERETGRGTGPVVYVSSQGLYYDSIVVADPLPMRGQFQELTPDMNGLTTEFGPGEPGHRGGRWWVDLNMDGLMDPDDHFFLCPLLGPGREEM
jgi:hypothetical protein